MVSTDPISDMLTRIRNAILVNKTEVTMPYSRLKETVARELVKSKFINKVKVEDGELPHLKKLTVTINEPGTNARITEIERLSKPGRRVYAGADEIPKVKSGRGVVIVSTSRGVMSGTEASKQRLGGELICKVY